MHAPPPPEALREKLQGEVLDALWDDLAAHAMLLLAPGIDLLDAAVAMARDDVPGIQRLLEAGALGRPSADTTEAWTRQPVRFQAVIVQPWVLAQVLGPVEAQLDEA